MNDATTTHQPRPRTKRRPYRRQQILDAAITLFAERGYHDTGMNDIGAIVGITGPGIYRHFPSKEAILEAAIEDAAEQMLTQVRQIAEGTEDPRERLDLLVANAVHNLMGNHELYLTAINERRNLSAEARALFSRSQRLRVEEWSVPLQEVRPSLTDAEARFIVSATQGMLVSSGNFDGNIEDAELEVFLFNLALTTLLGADPTT